MALFADLARDAGITLLFTSHDMAHACRYADRVVALRGGRVHFDRPSAVLAAADLETVFAA
jgi:phosphonate transport system ATP-binding protein